MDLNRIEPGSTLITSKNLLEALMVLSPKARRKFLLPVLFNQNGYQLNAIKLIESIVLHEKLFVLIDSNHRSDLLDRSETTDLQDIFIEIPHIEIAEIIFSLSQTPSLYEFLIPKVELTQNFSEPVDGIKELSLEGIRPMFGIENESIKNLHNSIFSPEDDSKIIIDGTGLNGFLPIIIQINNGDEFIGNALVTEEILPKYYSIDYTSISETTHFFNGYEIFKQQTLSLTSKEINAQIQNVNKWIGYDLFSLNVPLVFDYIVQKTKNSGDILKKTLELRYSKQAIDFRKQCMLFDQAIKTGNKKDILSMIGDVENAMNTFSKRFSGPLSYVDVSLSVPPGIGGNLQDIANFGKIIFKPHLVFLSRLYKSALKSNHTMDKFVRLLK